MLGGFEVVNCQVFATASGSPARSLAAVILGARATVVQHDQRVEADHVTDPRPARVPGAGPGREDGAASLPDQAVVAAVVRRGHPVLVTRLGQRVLADPGVPAAVVVDDDHGVLDGDRVGAGQDDGAPAGLEVLRAVGVDRLDPPVLAVGGRAGDVEPPGAVGGPQHDRPLERLGPELLAPHLADRLEVDAVAERATTVETPRPALRGRRTR